MWPLGLEGEVGARGGGDVNDVEVGGRMSEDSEVGAIYRPIGGFLELLTIKKRKATRICATLPTAVGRSR